MFHVARGDPFAGPGLSVPAPVWVEDAARAHALALEHLLFPPTPPSTASTSHPTTSSSASNSPAPPPRINGRAFHLAHDMANEPFLYGEFVGASLAPTRPHVPQPVKQQQQQTESDKGSSSSSSSSALTPLLPLAPPLQQGLNAYGLPPCRPLPRWLVGLMAAANEWVGQRLGMTLVDPFLRPGAWCIDMWVIGVFLLGMFVLCMSCRCAAGGPLPAPRRVRVGYGCALLFPYVLQHLWSVA